MAMNIIRIYSVLVPPLKHQPAEPLQGAEIPLTGELYDLLGKVFASSPKECDIPIIFPSTNQTHPVRRIIQLLVRNPSIEVCKELFADLAAVSTNVSGLALCFAIIGRDDRKHAAYLARFPATEAIRTQLGRQFRVELVRDIYMKSSRTYKAALFMDTSIADGFWTGRATDRQINIAAQELAQYWIYSFLKAEFEISSKSGSFMIARSLSGLINKETDPALKQQLIALATILPNQNGRSISIREMCERTRVPQKLQTLILDSLENKAAFQTQFQFDSGEFLRTVAFRSEYLDNGAVLTAPSNKFDECFRKESLSEPERTRYSTEGRLLEIKIRKKA